MEYFSDFNDIVYNTISNVFFTYITEGTPSDPERYKFLIPKDIPAVGQTPLIKQNFDIYYKFPKAQTDIRYRILYNLTAFSKNRPKVPGTTHEVSLTLDIMDKGESSEYSQNKQDNTSYLVEIANQLQNTQFWQQTINLMTDKDNFGTEDWTGTLIRDYQVISLDTLHIGSIKVDDSWKDILNINITFQNKGNIT
jgi:hypothetical protein